MNEGGKIRVVLAATLACVGIVLTMLPIVEQQEAIARDDDRYKKLVASFTQTDELATNSPASSAETTLQTVLPAQKPPQEYSIADQSAASAGYDELLALKSLNNDFVAWLQIPGTVIDYPVVRSDDADYYLHHLFTGQKSKLGCLFSLTTSDYETPSRNIAIYGHHLSTTDAMFSTLVLYKDESYYQEHPLIRLDTLYGSRSYRIFAVLNQKVTDWDASTAAFSNDAAFRQYIERAKRLSFYNTGVAVSDKDHILTLITCDRSYGGLRGRLLVMAVEEESKEENSCIGSAM